MEPEEREQFTRYHVGLYVEVVCAGVDYGDAVARAASGITRAGIDSKLIAYARLSSNVALDGEDGQLKVVLVTAIDTAIKNGYLTLAPAMGRGMG